MGRGVSADGESNEGGSDGGRRRVSEVPANPAASRGVQHPQSRFLGPPLLCLATLFGEFLGQSGYSQTSISVRGSEHTFS
jgi:hypothetical protein